MGRSNRRDRNNVSGETFKQNGGQSERRGRGMDPIERNGNKYNNNKNNARNTKQPGLSSRSQQQQNQQVQHQQEKSKVTNRATILVIGGVAIAAIMATIINIPFIRDVFLFIIFAVVVIFAIQAIQGKNPFEAMKGLSKPAKSLWKNSTETLDNYTDSKAKNIGQDDFFLEDKPTDIYGEENYREDFEEVQDFSIDEVPFEEFTEEGNGFGNEEEHKLPTFELYNVATGDTEELEIESEDRGIQVEDTKVYKRENNDLIQKHTGSFELERSVLNLGNSKEVGISGVSVEVCENGQGGLEVKYSSEPSELGQRMGKFLVRSSREEKVLMLYEAEELIVTGVEVIALDGKITTTTNQEENQTQNETDLRQNQSNGGTGEKTQEELDWEREERVRREKRQGRSRTSSRDREREGSREEKGKKKEKEEYIPEPDSDWGLG